MAISPHASEITLPPAAGDATVLEYLVRAFPHVAADEWAARVRDGKVTDEHGRPIDIVTPYVPARRIRYFREVPEEPVVPFAETIVYRDENILVADKPHFLPVTPGGRFVNECLLNRLRVRTGIAELAPVHRLDRETAGLVLFALRPQTRRLYHGLFARGEVEKTYIALARVERAPDRREWRIENRLARGEPRFRMRVVPGVANAGSLIRLENLNNGLGLFRLRPLTGKTHQLRVHMSGLGFGILNDRVYPELLPEQETDYGRPLQLLAQRLSFRDPVSGEIRRFESARTLLPQSG
jgi:tRNA pseudouridine32 synthase/23S rRNA pseudouridine746 synthase